MARDKYNLFRIDDVLIRIGWVIAIVALLVAWPLLAALTGSGSSREIRRRGVAVLVLAAPAIACLVTGYRIRSRERRAVTIWKKLELASEVAVADLAAATGYDDLQIAEALLLVKRRGNCFYISDRETGLVSDGRLRKKTIVVEDCPSCGSTIGRAFPVSLPEPPECPYCGRSLAAARWSELKEKALAALAPPPAAVPASAGAPSAFHMPTFILLMLLFWPGAIIYALRRNALANLSRQ